MSEEYKAPLFPPDSPEANHQPLVGAEKVSGGSTCAREGIPVDKLVTFSLQDDEYGFQIDFVQEVRRMKKIVYLPEASDFVEGVIKLRGEVVPVINLRKRLGLAEKEHERSTRIIIVKVKDHTLGVIVDSVNEVLAISRGDIDHPDSVLKDTAFLKGVAKALGRMILIIDIDRLLTLEDKELLEAVPRKVKTKKAGKR